MKNTLMQSVCKCHLEWFQPSNNFPVRLSIGLFEIQGFHMLLNPPSPEICKEIQIFAWLFIDDYMVMYIFAGWEISEVCDWQSHEASS